MILGDYRTSLHDFYPANPLQSSLLPRSRFNFYFPRTRHGRCDSIAFVDSIHGSYFLAWSVETSPGGLGFFSGISLALLSSNVSVEEDDTLDCTLPVSKEIIMPGPSSRC